MQRATLQPEAAADNYEKRSSSRRGQDMLTYLLGIKLKSRPGWHVVAAAAVVLALNLPLLRQPAQGGQRGIVWQTVCAGAEQSLSLASIVQHTKAATTATYKFIWPRGMLKLCHQIGINREREASLPAFLPG